MLLFNLQPQRKTVAQLAVSCFDLAHSQSVQVPLFESQLDAKWQRVSKACDAINDRYGEFVVTPALMMGMQDVIIDRIAFGGVKELEDVYSSK